MNFFDHKDLGNHLLQLCPKVVKHPVYTHIPEQMMDQVNAYHSPQTLSSSMGCTNVGDHLQPGNTNMLELTEEIKQHYTKEANLKFSQQ